MTYPNVKVASDRPVTLVSRSPVPSSDSPAQNLSRDPYKAGAQLPDRLAVRRPLYSVDERRRRDETVWTLVQGLLAPVQFVIFLVSLGLVIRSPMIQIETIGAGGGSIASVDASGMLQILCFE